MTTRWRSWPPLSPQLDLLGDPVVATDPEPRRRLWAVREAHGEAINRLGPPIKLDVSVPLDRWPRSSTALPAAAAERRPPSSCSATSATATSTST